MYQDDSGLEQRLSRFEAQLDRFSLALRQWQGTQGQLPAAGPPDLDQRIRALEETITREALALRQIHEEPLKQLQGQAESLGDLLRSLQALVADLRMGAGVSTTQGSAASWPLERVVHLHDELRRGANGGGSHSVHPGTVLPEVAGPPSRSVRLLQAANEHETASPHAIESRKVRTPGWYAIRVAAAVAGLVVIVVGFRWIETRLDEASARVAAAERQVITTTELANREVVVARQDADRQIAEARQLAQRAETVGVILTAPDLVRFNLTSAETVGPSAQLLWSRTRGLVLSGSRLPAAPPESTYQLWLVTSTQSVGAGLFVPDEAGRATLVVDAPPRVIGPVVGAAVTVEPSGGRPAPSGRTLLARFPRTEG
jgi:Anti-sigma-K factor rskA